MSSSKKGISTNQLHRTLGIGLKAAWFMSHRIREAMSGGELPLMSGPNGIVEADETYLWQSDKVKPSQQVPAATHQGRQGRPGQKRAIVSLVERGGSVRSFHVENADKATISIIENAKRLVR